MILTGAKKAQDQDTVGFWPVDVGACIRSGVCSQTAGFSAPLSATGGGILLELSANVLSPFIRRCLQTGRRAHASCQWFSKPVAGSRFCEEGFQNSFDKQQAAEMRCGHGPPARSSERKVFANRGRRIEWAQIYVYDRTRRTALGRDRPVWDQWSG